jgi:transposase InsO family protein
MKTTDVKRSIEAALEKTDITPNNRPRLLSDNGSCYISNELGVYLDEKHIKHVRENLIILRHRGK